MLRPHELLFTLRRTRPFGAMWFALRLMIRCMLTLPYLVPSMFLGITQLWERHRRLDRLIPILPMKALLELITVLRRSVVDRLVVQVGSAIAWCRRTMLWNLASCGLVLPRNVGNASALRFRLLDRVLALWACRLLH